MGEKRRKGKKSRFGKEYKGKCRICGCEGYTEMHHIINQHYAKTQLKQPELIKNHGNIVELCKSCHDHTDSSRYRVMKFETKNNYKLEKENEILKQNYECLLEQLKRAYGK